MTGAQIWQSADVSRGFLEGVRAAIPLAQQQIDVMLRLLRCGPAVGNFLDLGCGDGVLAAAVLSEYPSARALCADFSPEMVSAAQRRLPGSTVLDIDYGSPEWLEAVIPHAPFDAIVSGFSIHHQPDIRKRELYAELLGLLRPGGFFLNLEHVASPSAVIEAVHDDLFIDCLHALQLDRARAEVARTYHSRPDKAANLLTPVEEQCAWLREIGYVDVDCYFKVFELALFGGKRKIA